jgi:sialic acid synthase SpsE
VLDTGLEGLDELHRHETIVGISDRSTGTSIAVAAIERGACIVEKRLTTQHVDPTWLAATELGPLVRDCDAAWASLARRDRGFTTN